MKQILIALGIAAFACSSAMAQQGSGCKTARVAHHHRKHATKIVVNQVATLQESCRLLPYEVCTINPDRQSVTCYKTMDPEANKPLNDQTTFYGSVGKEPGQPLTSGVRTIVVKGEPKGDFCIRNAEDRETICYHNGSGLWRDEDGFYHYGVKP